MQAHSILPRATARHGAFAPAAILFIPVALLAILVVLFRNRRSINVQELNTMKG